MATGRPEAWRVQVEALEFTSAQALHTYRALVYGTPGFETLFWELTVIPQPGP